MSHYTRPRWLLLGLRAALCIPPPRLHLCTDTLLRNDLSRQRWPPSLTSPPPSNPLPPLRSGFRSSFLKDALLPHPGHWSSVLCCSHSVLEHGLCSPLCPCCVSAALQTVRATWRNQRGCSLPCRRGLARARRSTDALTGKRRVTPLGDFGLEV